ncbi:hypothetical protein PVAND_008213 [Polypedilum vanderplanki]|uniref:Cuticle protein n=1 Tax=Polypedilum vanderplanki TaxID=319348 RepID=A0A9J6C8S5_POLVA|nr:hypothetical protein PVAND_008213 [Polypedilum vanderplanki]
MLFLLLTLTLEIKSASIWYTGENKPYEFGYTIEGNQHRRESKDIHGRINGEYGFITADNVYHVTVYATDENGNFKILSMKNIKLNQFPDQSFIPSTTVQPFTVKTTSNSFDMTTTDVSQKSETCASCALPSKPAVDTVKPTIISDKSDNDSSTTIPPPFKIVSKNDPLNSENVNQNVENSLNEANKIGNNQYQQQSKNNQLSNANSRQPQMNEKLNFELSNKLQGEQQYQNKLNNNNGLLYRFNYATDFQGHQEEGDYSGNKNGEYFSIGRDNIKRIVSYNANEFGFMPQIRHQPISQQYDERNNQLRQYNFEWFYPNSVLYG